MTDRLSHIRNKIISLETAVFHANAWRVKNEKIVFTNGCFDILHEGHITYLAQAASYGAKMIVGLNTDASVRRQGKGDDRPVNNEASRAMVLASLTVVEAVVLFEEDTPYELIKAIQPEVLAKGADYDPNETDPSKKSYIVGSDLVRLNGGRIVAIPLVEGFSTTNIIKKLKG